VLGAAGLAVLLLWLATGIYPMGRGAQGVVIRRFGKQMAVTGAGRRAVTAHISLEATEGLQ